jgi:Double zinc ribbon
MKCTACQFNFPDQARFCPGCGEGLEKDLGALLARKAFPARHSQGVSYRKLGVALKCPVCRKRRPIEFNYCSSDGYPFEGIELDLLGSKLRDSLRRESEMQ